MIEKKYWLSSYDVCDMCHKPIKGVVPFFVDGKTTYGPWAIMCPECYKKYGVNIGYGVGQKYDGTTAELLDGGSPHPEEDDWLGLSHSEIIEALGVIKNEL